MAESFLVPWKSQEEEEFVFASNTTIITEDLIINAMNLYEDSKLKSVVKDATSKIIKGSTV